MRKINGYAVKFDREERPFQYFGESKKWVELHTSMGETVPVILEEKEGGGYWAWWDNEEETFMWLWGSKLQVQMAFPDHGANAVATGRGDFVEVAVTETKEEL